jgi:hypothetical protein
MARMTSLAAWLGQWFATPRAAPSPPALPGPAELVTADRADAPAERGLPAIDVADVMAPHRDRLLRLRDAYGAEQAAFDRDIGSVVERYAQTVHLLPATPDGPFGHAGGLFRMGLDIGFYALQASDSVLFPARPTISARATLEPRWRYATFLAGLCCELHRSLSHLTVSNDQGAAWPAYRQPLALWLRDTGSRRYHVHWTGNTVAVRALGVVAMTHVVAPPILQHLAQGNGVIVPHLVAALSGTAFPGEVNTLDGLVRRASALVRERALRPTVEHPERVPPAPDSALRATAAPGASAPAARPAATPSPPRAKLELVAPARLHPAVREALRQIVASLESPALPPAAWIIDAGVFVPLREIARRQVDPALAVRALGDAGMLACAAGEPQSRTCLRSVDRESVLGVVLARGCVSGWDEFSGGAASAR